MKKVAILLMTFILVFALSITSYAYYMKTKSIPSVRITINTGELILGDDLSNVADAYVSIPDNQYYEIADAEWLDDVSELKVGDAPRMQVTLSAIPKEVESNNYSTVYLFTNTYSSSSVSIKNGEFISADRRDNDYLLLVTLRIKAVNGTYDAPDTASWSSVLGQAQWTVDHNDSEYYDITLYRGGSSVKKLTNYHGNSYNFYPYMTKEGEYYYKVRTVPVPGSNTGKSSEWTESGGLSISSSQVSDGSGQTTADENGGNGTVASGTITTINGQNIGDTYGWITQGQNRYFRYPDGKLAVGWLKLDGTWYHFDNNGCMQTGWFQNKYGKWFYLDPMNGAMKTGWFNDNGNYYYLSTATDDTEGVMAVGFADIGGKRYYFNDHGMMVTGWRNINNSYYYFYPKGTAGGDFGYMAVNTKIGDFTVGADGAWRP